MQPFFDPLGVRFFRCGKIFDIRITEKLLIDGINGNHLPRGEPAFFDDRLFGNVADANFGAHEEKAIFGDFIAGGSEAVSIKAGGNDSAVAERESGRSVPRLIHALVIFVKSPNFGGKGFLGAVGGRNKHKHCMEGTAARNGEKFEGVIQAGGVASAGLDDGVQKREIGRVEAGMREIGFAGVNPVTISPKRINFSVVSDHAERVGERPSGESIGAISLVEDGQGGLVSGILKIEVEAFELSASEHAFVNDDSGAKGGDIKWGGAVCGTAVFDFVPSQKENHFKSIIREFFGVGSSDKELFDSGGGEGGLFP